jgi:hypothetical protein
MNGRKQQAAYAARTIRAFLDGSCGDHDWDDFTSCSLRDSEVDRIRRHARDVDVPVDHEGTAILLSLADKADRIAAPDGS